jgi:uroporphyrinogen decarboxylase
MKMNLNHRQRIRAAIRGEPTDRVPVALWRHFPNDDLRAETLAARVVEFQNKFEFDFVKVTPASGFPAEMYGATFKDGRNREGTRAYVARPVNSIGDWDKIVPLDDSNPVTQREDAALTIIRSKLGADIPILQTVFAPLNTAHNLAGERLFADLLAQPRVLHRALEAIAETTKRFALSSLRSGADAIFFATQMATSKYFNAEEFREFGESYDLDVLKAIRAANPDFILLHIHGINTYFDLLAKYPVDIINWHDRRTAPTLKQAREKFGGALMGGLHELDTLLGKSREAIMAQAREAIAQTNGRGFILGAGCVIQVDTPEENIRAVIEGVTTE